MTSTSRSTPGLARLALSVPVVLLLSTLAWLNWHAEQKLINLRSQEAVTQGQVTSKYCSNHGQVFYSFSVAGHPYFGAGSCPINCDRAQIGASLPITYSQKDPENSTCENLGKIESQFEGNYWALTVVAAGFAVGIYRVTRSS